MSCSHKYLIFTPCNNDYIRDLLCFLVVYEGGTSLMSCGCALAVVESIRMVCLFVSTAQ
jgi:hypothetical protein